MLEPAVLIALAVLIVNDHVLKGAAPAPITGILSGFAGIILVPAMLVAAVELTIRRASGPSLTPMLIACAFVGTAYAAVEVMPVAADIYRWTWGVLQWAARIGLGLLTGAHAGPPGVVPVAAVRDPLDLLALPALAVPLWLQVGRIRSRSGGSV